MSGVTKERYLTAHGKEYELALIRPWDQPTQEIIWYCWVSATPLSQSLSQSQNVQICIRLPFHLLAQLDVTTEQIPEGFIWLSVQLILEKQSGTSDEVKLLFTDEGLKLESFGKTERNELLGNKLLEAIPKPR